MSDMEDTATTQVPNPARRRRRRIPKSCRICHKRKVRCDSQQPCSTCVRRDHPQLCVYDKAALLRNEQPGQLGAETAPIIDRQQLSPAAPTRRVSRTQLQGDDGKSTTPAGKDDCDNLPAASSTGSHHLLSLLDAIAIEANSSCETDPVTGQVTYVGRFAHANYFRALLIHIPEQVLPPCATIETVFGLTNRTISRPFATFWNVTARVTTGDILRSLPSPEMCMRYYRAYQELAQPFFPVLHDTSRVERSLCTVIDILVAEVDEKSIPAADLPPSKLAEYALLFAILASGCQCCLVAEGDNQLALSCRVFVACSFECLQLANHYVTPNSETIQATLILEHVACNDGNPGVAAGMLGMTARQAQGLGLHCTVDCSCRSSNCQCPQSVRTLWKAILTLDARLSMNYDRPPTIFLTDDLDARLDALAQLPQLLFSDCMFHLDCMQVQWQSKSYGNNDNNYAVDRTAIDSYLEHAKRLEQIVFGSNTPLAHPASVQATLERQIFTIHLSLFRASLHLRAAVMPSLCKEARVQHFHHMTSNFCSLITTYLKLRRLSPAIVKLAWEISRAVKSASILLAAFETILCESFSGNILCQLNNAFSESSSLRSWGDDAAASSCSAGAETLKNLIAIQQSRMAVGVAEELHG